MFYNTIVNPLTGRKVSVFNKLGQSIIKNYLNQSGGFIRGGIRMPGCDAYASVPVSQEGGTIEEEIKELQKLRKSLYGRIEQVETFLSQISDESPATEGEDIDEEVTILNKFSQIQINLSDMLELLVRIDKNIKSRQSRIEKKKVLE